MSRITLGLCAVFTVALVITQPGLAKEPAFKDPVDTPAAHDAHPTSEPLLAIAKAGQRLVAVGLRGLIIVSDDRGRTWAQVPVPVQSDLVAIDFLNAQRGWVTGHGGVILATHDGGDSWKKVFDGRKAKRFVKIYRKRAENGAPRWKRYVQVMKENTSNGPQLPFNDIWFRNEQQGYAVGSFGMLITTGDGGKTWLPWLSHIDNKRFFHLKAIRKIGRYVYITGEKGRVYRLNEQSHHFTAMSPGYKGTFFGLLGKGSTVLAYGLQGTVYRSTDAGATWRRVEAGLDATASAGSVLDDGRYLIFSEDGQAVVSDDAGKTFSEFPTKTPQPFADVIEVGHKLVLVGLGGVQIQSLR